MLLTRTPLYSQGCPCFLVRLACVKRAASVDSEPGSNSRLISFICRDQCLAAPISLKTVRVHRLLTDTMRPRLLYSNSLTNYYFVYGVQPDCQTSMPGLVRSLAGRRPSGCKPLSGGTKPLGLTAQRVTVPAEEAAANYVPAAAVIRRQRALFGVTGRKGCVGGSLSLV